MDDPLAPYSFVLPDERIARFPPPERDGGRLLDLVGGRTDRRIVALPELLRDGDLLVLNDVAVHRARIRARRASGGAVEVMLARPLDGGAWEALVRPARRLEEGERLAAGVGAVRIEARLPGGTFRVRPEPDVDAITRSAGEVPLPPYLRRAPEPADEERYQTVYAREQALRASAAPTAGLHFTPALLAAIESRGVRRVAVTLEVGLGTFQPLRVEQIEAGRLHEERFQVPTETWHAIAATRRAGGRVVAVGTTAARVLESATGPGGGSTDLFIRPGYPFRTVDVLLTNFHLPESSLLMLVCAFGGYERVMDAYAHAVAEGYRFFSYGDAMLIDRG